MLGTGWVKGQSVTQLVVITVTLRITHKQNLTGRLCLSTFPRELFGSQCVFMFKMSDRWQTWVFHTELSSGCVCVYPESGPGRLNRAGHGNPPCRRSLKLKATHVGQIRKMEAYQVYYPGIMHVWFLETICQVVILAYVSPLNSQ